MSDIDLSELDNIDDLEDDVGLTEEDQKHGNKPNQVEWFKGVAGQTYLVSVIHFHPITVSGVVNLRKRAKKEGKTLTEEDQRKYALSLLAKRAEKLEKPVEALTPTEKLDLDQIQFRKILAHYQQGLGYVMSLLGKDGKDMDDVWKRLPEAKKYFTTILLVYPANKQGELNKEALATNQYQVIPWRLSNKSYMTLHETASTLRSNSINISGQDLALKCTNSDFQNFEISSRGPALWRKNAKFMERVLKEALEVYKATNELIPFRSLSSVELMDKLGLTPEVSDDSSDGDDMEGFFEEV